MKSHGIQVVGICGRSGSGKGYVCRIFNEMGIPSIDTDSVYRDLITVHGSVPSACLTEITDAFGTAILDGSGSLNKRALAEIVFAPGNELLLKRLDAIAHKHIKEKVLQEIALLEDAGSGAVLIDAPVLFESGFDKLCNLKFYVCTPLKLSLRRICERDGITEEQARKRLDAQMTNSALETLCDGVIVNDGIANVRKQVADIIQSFSLIGQT